MSQDFKSVFKMIIRCTSRLLLVSAAKSSHLLFGVLSVSTFKYGAVVLVILLEWPVMVEQVQSLVHILESVVMQKFLSSLVYCSPSKEM